MSIRVKPAAHASFECIDAGDLVVGEFPVEYCQVFFHAQGVGALGQGHQVLLDLPAQNHLGYGFTGFGGDGFEGSVLEQVGFAAQG